MPSIRSCLTSLALMAFTVAPVISAKSHDGAALVAREAHPIARSVNSPAANLEKRVNSSKRAAAKAAAKKRADARRAAKAAAAERAKKSPKKAAGSGTVAAAAAAGGAAAGSVLASSGSSSGSPGAFTGAGAPSSGDAYAPGSVFQSSTVALAAQNRKCTRDKNCADVQLIDNSYAVCYLRRCSLRCNTGYAPGGSDGQECVPAATGCNAEPNCPAVSGGYTTCNADGTCNPQCATSQGLTLFQSQSTGQYICLSLKTDKNNCGSAGNVCASSYNGVGTPACFNGACNLRCTAGTYQMNSGNAAQPLMCSAV